MRSETGSGFLSGVVKSQLSWRVDMKQYKLIAYVVAALVVVALVFGAFFGERMAAQDNADTVREPAASAAPAD